MLKSLACQANWEQGAMWVVMWVDYQPVDIEIECDSIRILVFEMWIGMNKF